MIKAERFILIGCLLQGALGRKFEVRMPQRIEALSGSCVLIPCTFDIEPQYDKDLTDEAKGLWKKSSNNGEIVFDSNKTENTIKGTLIGKLEERNCTTILDRFPLAHNDTYFFRLESQTPLMYNFPTGVKINVQDSPPKPKITTERVEVMEGTSVSLSCSAAAPCPELPPNLTWTPRLNDSVDQLQENEDRTKSVSSVLTFTASHLHHGKNITCRALHTLQQGDTMKTSEASLSLRVLYPPKNTSVSVSPSGSVLVGSSVTLTCSSNANPAVQNYTWYKVNGTEMHTVGTGQNLTFNVTESSGSKQYYCEAQNEHGKENSTTVQLNVIYMPQISGSGSCSRTAAEISCSCESRGNPSPSMEWHVSGLRVTNSTDRVIREEQLGNTGLRSSLTMRQSQGDTPTLLCVSTNTLGNSSLQLHLPSPQQPSGFRIYLLLIGAAAAAGAMAIIYLITKAIQKQGKKRDSQCSDSRMKDTKGKIPEKIPDKRSQIPPPAAEEDSVYANHTMATAQHRDPQLGGTDPQIPPREEGQNRAELEAMHYASIKHSPRPVETQGQDACDGAAGRGADVVYSQVALKSKNKKGKAEGGEG
ncbi:B-cell receptor CD22-like [Anguilla anguilla]|uniref:B-cell receptor CD22-like n=1 Tax=Anguilla anguilla TaxID=7936 RepID=UPI0015A78CD9|nr:B-cell receptor CD22-like [Anguilla anguilla]